MGHIRIILSAINRRWSHRRRFSSLRDWGITLYDAALRYFTRAPLPFRGKTCPVKLRNVHGAAYLRLGTSDGAVLEEIFVRDVYKPVTSHNLGHVEHIVDVGANVGLSVKLWLEQFPGARVIAVEPDEGNLTACRRNTVAAGVGDRVTLIKACVAASPGVVHLSNAQVSCAYEMTHETDVVGTVPVQALTMPQILATWDAPGAPTAFAKPTVDLMKVDIEGAEQEVFGDCASWIGRVRALMIELHHPYSQEMFLRDLARANAQLELVDSRIVSGNPLLFLRV